MVIKSLKDLSVFIKNGATIKQDGTSTIGFPITRIETLADDRFNRNKMGYAEIKNISDYEGYVLEDGDILYSHINGPKQLGRAICYKRLDDEIIIHGMNLLNIRLKKEIVIPKYIEYYLHSKNALSFVSKNMKRAVNQASIPASKVGETPIIYYPIEEQIKIASILDKINSIIDADKKQLELYDEMIKSRFIEMFKNKYYPKTQIRNVVDIKKISAKKTYEKDDKIRYIDISSIDNSTNQVIGYTPYVFKDAPSRAQQCLKNGDILVSTVRPNLKNIAIFNGDSTDCVGSSGFCVLRASKCSIQYLKYIVLDDEFTEAMVKLTTGASYPAIRDDDVLDYEMIDAPIELQNEFASFVELIDKSKFNVQKHIIIMQELLDKKMDEYFGG